MNLVKRSGTQNEIKNSMWVKAENLLADDNLAFEQLQLMTCNPNLMLEDFYEEKGTISTPVMAKTYPVAEVPLCTSKAVNISFTAELDFEHLLVYGRDVWDLTCFANTYDNCVKKLMLDFKKCGLIPSDCITSLLNCGLLEVRFILKDSIIFKEDSVLEHINHEFISRVNSLNIIGLRCDYAEVSKAEVLKDEVAILGGTVDITEVAFLPEYDSNRHLIHILSSGINAIYELNNPDPSITIIGLTSYQEVIDQSDYVIFDEVFREMIERIECKYPLY